MCSILMKRKYIYASVLYSIDKLKVGHIYNRVKSVITDTCCIDFIVLDIFMVI
jgi:hypothetical protein